MNIKKLNKNELLQLESDIASVHKSHQNNLVNSLINFDINECEKEFNFGIYWNQDLWSFLLKKIIFPKDSEQFLKFILKLNPTEKLNTDKINKNQYLSTELERLFLKTSTEHIDNIFKRIIDKRILDTLTYHHFSIDLFTYGIQNIYNFEEELPKILKTFVCEDISEKKGYVCVSC
jgi:hypothetical protein